MNKFMLGFDVEGFGQCLTTKTIQPLSPAIVPGRKGNAVAIGSFASIELDNVLAEVTAPPSATAAQFATAVQRSKQEYTHFLNNRGFHPVFKAHHIFRPSELLSPWAQAIGCEPDFASNLDDPVPELDSKMLRRLRTAGGHLHINWTSSDPERTDLSTTDVIQYVRTLDFALVAPLTLMSPSQKIRRKMYGQAGRFRFKDYGFEIRGPDSWWYGQDNTHLHVAMFNTIKKVMNIDNSYFDWVNYNHTELCHYMNNDMIDELFELYDQFSYFKLALTYKDDVATTKSRIVIDDLHSEQDGMHTTQLNSLFETSEPIEQFLYSTPSTGNNS